MRTKNYKYTTRDPQAVADGAALRLFNRMEAMAFDGDYRGALKLSLRLASIMPDLSDEVAAAISARGVVLTGTIERFGS